jgi:hypothetical protein
VIFTGNRARPAYLSAMRKILCLIMMSSPAAAWEFTPGTPCLLSHDKGSARIELTFDPTVPIYSITISQAASLPETDVFAMRFDGPAGLTISTDRLARAASGTSVTVTDSGFGNVLNGLQFNQTATAILGETTIRFPLTGAAEPVAAFRACDVAPSV